MRSECVQLNRLGTRRQLRQLVTVCIPMLQELNKAAGVAWDRAYFDLTEGGGGSAVPAETLTAMQTSQVSILEGSTTVEPTAQVQVCTFHLPFNLLSGNTIK